MHFVMGCLFRKKLLSQKTFDSPSDKQTCKQNAFVILTMRGSDPYLLQTLEALANQNHSNFAIRMVVDSESDPSWKVVEQFAKSRPDVDIKFSALKDRAKNRSLKCGSIVQAVESVREEIGKDSDAYILFCDADVVPYPAWANELIAPLSDPEIGISSGSQWFSPEKKNLGSLTRSIWHSGAIIPTVLYKHPWAGSCALRLSDIERTGLLDKWKITIVDDGPICEVYKPFKLKTFIVPEVIILNRDACNLKFCTTYIRRMLTWSRIYESTFFLTPLHVFGISSSLLVAFGLLIYGLFTTSLLFTALPLIGLLIFAVTMLITYIIVEKSVREVFARRGEILNPPTMGELALLVLFFPLATCIYCSVLPHAMFTKQVTWRAITYKIKNKWDITMLEDVPYPTTPQDSQSSI